MRAKERGSQQGAAQLWTEVEQQLAALDGRVVEIVPLGVYENAMVAHFEILMKALLALAGLTALVGALGLSSSVAVSVLERTRELGVLRAIGASGKQVRNIVIAEGMLVGGLSLVIACILGLALADPMLAMAKAALERRSECCEDRRRCSHTRSGRSLRQ